MNQRSKIILNIFISDLDNDTLHFDYLQISYNLTVYSIYTPMHAYIIVHHVPKCTRYPNPS